MKASAPFEFLLSIPYGPIQLNMFLLFEIFPILTVKSCPDINMKFKGIVEDIINK